MKQTKKTLSITLKNREETFEKHILGIGGNFEFR